MKHSNIHSPQSDTDTGGEASNSSEGVTRGDIPATGTETEGVEEDVWDAVYGIEDPELPVSIVDLGLIYGIDVEDGVATVKMTLTYSGCPARELIMDDVEHTVTSVAGVSDVEVELMWTPEWSIEFVTEQGRADLREFGVSFEE